MTFGDVWRRYWFRPAPLLDLAVVRVVAVALQLLLLLRSERREAFEPLASLPDALYDPLAVLRLLTLPFGWRVRPDAEVVEAAYWVTVGAGILALIGLRTNLALALFAVGNVFVQAYLYSFGDLHHPEAVMMIALGVLALSPAGAVLSVDDLLRRMRGARRARAFAPFDLAADRSEYAAWPLLTVRWTFALVYLSAAAAKLHGSGLDWMNGHTLRFYMLRDGLRWGSDLGLWLAEHQVVAVLLSWGAILYEATFWLVLVVPPLALLYVPAGVGLHTGIYLVQRAPFFQFVALYAVFVPWASVLRGARSRGPRPVVLFDDACPLCIRSMVLLRYADWLDRLDYAPLSRRFSAVAARKPGLSLDECRREMHVVWPDGRVERGFGAFRALLRHLPPLWPLLPLAHLPGVARIGAAVYARVASRRHRLPACTFEACGLDDATPTSRP